MKYEKKIDEILDDFEIKPEIAEKIRIRLKNEIIEPELRNLDKEIIRLESELDSVSERL